MEFPTFVPFARELGLELLRFESGEAEIAVDFRPELGNSWGIFHGGVTMALLDVTMAHAARSLAGARASSPRAATVEMKTSFLRAASGRLVARGKVLHRTSSLAFCEGSVFDAAGALVAHATGTFKYRRADADEPPRGAPEPGSR